MTLLNCAPGCGDISFRDKPFDEVDGLILSNILYCDFQTGLKRLANPESIPLDLFLKNLISNSSLKKTSQGLFLGTKPIRLAKKIHNTTRYKDIVISDFEEINNEEKNIQFAAICYHIVDNLIYLCYRGTDDSLIGWMENLNLFLEEKMPSQICANDYLNRMMEKYPKATFILGGHSKGGNICVYAATYCKETYKKRIQKIYSYDGTGFYPHTFDYDKFKELEEKTLLVAPFDCIVGNLLEQPIKNRIVVSCNKTGLFCHDIHTWKTDGVNLLKAEKQEFSNRSLITIHELNQMVYDQSYAKRKDFVIDFNNAVRSCSAKTLNDLRKNTSCAFNIYKKLSLHSKSLLLKTIRTLIINNFKLN